MTAAIIGAVFVILATLITRATTRDIANLQAQHKVLDKQMEKLNEYVTAVMACESAAEKYFWIRTQDDRTEFDEKYLDRAHEKRTVVRYIAATLPPTEEWDSILQAHPKFMSYTRELTLKKFESEDDAFEFYGDKTGEFYGASAELLNACRLAEMDFFTRYKGTAPDSLGDEVRRRFRAVFHPRR
ncbi:MAG: hypothetical protein PGN29_19545 [Gordonia paraffinivorans]